MHEVHVVHMFYVKRATRWIPGACQEPRAEIGRGRIRKQRQACNLKEKTTS